MAVTSAVLRMLLQVDDQASGPMEKAADKSGDAWSKAEKKLKQLAIGAVIVGFAKEAVSAASNLEQAMGATDAVFGDSADTIHGWAKDATDNIRLPAAAFEDMAASIGATWKRAGTPMDQLADKTKETMGLAADLAARWGTSTTDALDAIQSGIARNEWEKIEKYNVNVNQAAVNAEKAALATGSMAGATDAAITTQARYNLVVKQSGDAIGAAAEESNTFAAQQESFNEVWQNLLAAVGGPLLGALGSLLQMFGNLATAIAPAAVALSELLGWILQLPGPLQAAIALGAGWAIFGGKISAAVQGMVEKFQAGITKAGGFGGALANLGKSLASGAAIGAAAWAIGEIISIFTDAHAAAQEAAQGAREYGQAILDAGGASTDAAKEFRRNQLEQSDAFKGLIENGATYGEAFDYLSGKLTNASDLSGNLTNAIMGLSGVQKDSLLATIGQADAAQAYADQKQASIDAEKAAAAATEGTTVVTEEQTKALAAQSEEQRKVALEAAQAAAAQTEVAVALDAVKKAADDSSRALDYFSIAMDKAAGRNISAEQAAKGLNEAMRGLPTAFSEAGASSDDMSQTLANWDYATLTSTEKGSALYDQLSDVRQAYDDTTIAAYESALANGSDAAGAFDAAAGAAQSSYDWFIQQATAATGSAEAAQALAAKLGILNAQQLDPKTFEIIAKDADARDKVIALQQAGIDPKDIIITATEDEATGAISNVVSVAEGANPNVDVGAITGEADSAIGKVENGKYDATVKVGADTMEAARSIAAMSSGRYTAMILVSADTTAAANAVNNFTAAYRTSTVTVFANTQPFENAMRGITSGSYSATVTVRANTAAASASIASVAPAMAAPAGLAAPSTLAAPYPALHGSKVIPASSSVNYTINVDGGLDSGETIARRIETVLRHRDRRAFGVRL